MFAKHGPEIESNPELLAFVEAVKEYAQSIRSTNPLAPYVQHKSGCLRLQGIAGGYDDHELPACTCGLTQAIEAQEARMTDYPHT